MQGTLGVGDDLAEGVGGRILCARGAVGDHAAALDVRGEKHDHALDCAAARGFVGGGFLGGRGGALARVEGMRERLPEIALCDRIAVALQREIGRSQLFGREDLGTRGPRGLDGALCLVKLFQRRLAAGNEADGEQQQQGETAHRGPV